MLVTQVTDAGGFWSHPLTVGIAVLIVGAPIMYFLAWLQFRRHRPRKAIRCSTTYCNDFLTPTASGLGDLEILLGGEALSNPTIICFKLTSIGDSVIENLRVHVDAGAQDRIIRHNFYVDQQVKCERLKVSETGSRSLRFTWDYINPNDSIELVLLVSPCASPDCVSIEIDAKDLKVEREGMQSDCSLTMEFC